MVTIMKNKRHLVEVLDFMTENGEESWLGDVTLACDDGKIKLNLLIVCLIFPEFGNIQASPNTVDVHLIITELTKAEIRCKIREIKNILQEENAKSMNDTFDDDVEDVEKYVETSTIFDVKENCTLSDKRYSTLEEKETNSCEICQDTFKSIKSKSDHIQYTMLR